MEEAKKERKKNMKKEKVGRDREGNWNPVVFMQNQRAGAARKSTTNLHPRREKRKISIFRRRRFLETSEKGDYFITKQQRLSIFPFSLASSFYLLVFVSLFHTTSCFSHVYLAAFIFPPLAWLMAGRRRLTLLRFLFFFELLVLFTLNKKSIWI